jgi:glycosyltransferase involved in cell wall biosynthesis
MKVLYVYEHLTIYGGVERIFIEKMNYLVNNYYDEVFLLTYNQGHSQMTFELDEKIKYTDLCIMTFQAYKYRGMRRLWEMLKRQYLFKRKLRDYILSLVPDIIISTTIGPIGYLLEIKGNARLIIESHGGYDHIIDSLNNSVLNRCFCRLQKHRIKKADCVVSLSEGDAALWRTYHHSVVVIPNFIHFSETESFSTLENKQVIFVGRYTYQKAIPDLVEIWKLVNIRHPDWSLEMYGKGRDEDFLDDVVKHNDYNINLHLPTSDIHRRLVESSIFILASYYESFGLVIGEAMSCGLPVVAFNCPFGPAEQIKNGENGFLVENRDIKTFADRVCQLIEDKEMRKKMGHAGIMSVQRYRPEVIMPKWKELFESLVSC